MQLSGLNHSTQNLEMMIDSNLNDFLDEEPGGGGRWKSKKMIIFLQKIVSRIEEEFVLFK